MKKNIQCLVRFLAVPLVLSALAATLFAANPVKIIYDTDMGNDADDVLALAMLHGFMDRSECELLAVTSTKDNINSARFVELINGFYGRGDIPVGKATNGVEPSSGSYLEATLNYKTPEGALAFPWCDLEKEDFDTALTVLRRTLAAAEDQSVAIVQVGFSSNLAALLGSEADEISPLSGKELMAKKVRFVSIMAGGFTPQFKNHAEYNVVNDIPAAKKLTSECPVPIYASGFEVGLRVPLGPPSMPNDYQYVDCHPVATAFHIYHQFLGHEGGYGSQPTWDLTSVLYAVRPDRDYFGVSPAGVIHVADDGTTSFEEKADGKDHILTINDQQVQRVQEAFVWLCSEPPVKRAN